MNDGFQNFIMYVIRYNLEFVYLIVFQSEDVIVIWRKKNFFFQIVLRLAT